MTTILMMLTLMTRDTASQLSCLPLLSSYTYGRGSLADGLAAGRRE